MLHENAFVFNQSEAQCFHAHYYTVYQVLNLTQSWPIAVGLDLV